MNTSFFGELLQTISERGRALLDRGRDRRGNPAARSENLIGLCEDLLTGRGEASGVALARDILSQYADLTIGPRIAFFESLAQRFGTDPARIVTEIFTLLDDKGAYGAMARAHNPFGDGKAASRIMELMANAGML